VDDAECGGAAGAGPILYADNAAAMWASLAPVARQVPGMPPGMAVFDIPVQRAGRIILRRPGAAGPGRLHEAVTAAGRHGQLVIEDSFGGLVLPGGADATVDRMPLMLRAAGDRGPAPDGAATRVVRVTGPGELAEAERVIVDGFPRRALQPFRQGRMLPAEALAAPGWRAWLAYHGGEPAAACCSHDDGASVGIYWLATLPRYRSLGLGRAVMAAVLGACPGRPAVLVATAAGQPLYASLGFTTVSEAAWYRFRTSATPSA
jgi:GNAT superfamily N-acetyltransferase